MLVFVEWSKAKSFNKNILGTKWVFKCKLKTNELTRFMFYIVFKGYMHVPGADYTEKFILVTSDTRLCLILAITVLYKDKSWICKLVDIEVVCLKKSIEQLRFLEWSSGLVKTRYIKSKDLVTKYIRLEMFILVHCRCNLKILSYTCHTFNERRHKAVPNKSMHICINFQKKTSLFIVSCHADNTQLAKTSKKL